MPDYRMQVEAAADTILPRDRFVNTLYFKDNGALSDPDGLCEDLAIIFRDFWYVAARQITVKAYELGPPPQFPKGEHTLNANVAPATNGVREVAMCLSFYSEQNVPRKRGRIFLPAVAGGLGTGALRPSAPDRTKALTLGGKFAALGGVDVDWCQHSQTTGAMNKVSDLFVDDEWDIVRKRGLRPSTRSVATTTG